MANRNFANKNIYTGHVYPVQLDCIFTVDATNGLGITGLAGPYVQNVFMHTSTTPSAGNSNPSTPGIVVTNPNPASGTIVVQLQDNYTRLYDLNVVITSPNGTPVAITAASTNLTIGVAYVISTLGDATAADWLAVGVPSGITPAVGVAFIAIATGAGTGTTSRVAPSAAAGSGIFTAELVGTTRLSLAPNPTSVQGYGGQIILQCRNGSGSSAASAIAAPAAGSVIRITALLSNSSVTINGD